MMLCKIIRHEIKSKNLFSISLIFTITAVFVGVWGNKTIDEYMYIVFGTGILGLLFWYVFINIVKDIERDIIDFKENMITAKIIEKVRARYLIYFTFEFSVNGVDYIINKKVPNTLKSRRLRNNEELRLVYNSENPEEVYIYDLFFRK